MSWSRLRPPLARDLAWLGRGAARWPVAVACLLPECNALVNRSERGRQGWFHSRSCGREFRSRRLALLAEVERLERLLSEREGQVSRREVGSELRYLRTVLLTYPDLGEVPSARR